MRTYLKRVVVAAGPIIAAVASLLSLADSAWAAGSMSEVEKALQAVVEQGVARNKGVPGVALHVVRTDTGWSWSGAAGFADPARQTPLSASHPVRIASVTKTFVAAGILRLAEQERIAIDEPLSSSLTPESLRILSDGGYDPDLITIRHLLTHTSGLYDYAFSAEYLKHYEEDPQRHWTQREQLEGAMRWGKPHGPPGQAFHYCDTGYILLGEILERETGLSMGEALRNLLDYEKIGLRSTWHETFEPPPAGILDRAHQFEGERDTYDFDPSIDLYGGGGLVSTVGDLARFMQALFTGQVFAKPGTLELMLSPPPIGTNPRSPDEDTESAESYRMGIVIAEIDGITTYQHSGYWGTRVAYAPSLHLAMAVTMNQTEQSDEILGALLRQTLGAMQVAAADR